ncbi:quinone oxidoreductase family protein [Sphingobacterium faecale]|uniref:NADP-dependent oxidoreductase n=1 Tax=Sphingobacterium faecale TaxID=2803775 RepID=A0ABS1R5F7_9SPHI|nr:NADP-dependent oxidoreductase [Sphingobacterium faecale]MBL1409943.1 NADP-dependent oxidoreductase [Sphingobacterium faecale]
MKAITLKNFGSVENFEFQELEQPQIQAHEVLVKIRATAFNPIDYQMRQGSTESKLLKSPILGREFSGEIVKLGKDVNYFNIGDKVSAYVGSLASNGTYAEFISVPAKLLAKNPDKISFEEAAAIPMVGMTALQSFKRVTIPREKPIFIAGGAGGVGTIFIKLLLANGNMNIYTTAGNNKSISHLKSIGIRKKNIINYKNEDVIDVLSKKNGQFEYVIDLVGGTMSEICVELITVFGTYIDVTFLATEKAKEQLFDKATTILNIANYAPALKNSDEKFEYYGNALQELFDKIEKDIISPTEINIVGKLSIETVQKAHLMMENNQTNGKKLIMTID